MARDIPDEPLLAHYAALKDRRDGSAINASTTRVALYNFNKAVIDNEKLRLFTDSAQLMRRCIVTIGLDNTLPPSSVKSSCDYNLYVGFSNLLTAPCIRLECRFGDYYDPRAATSTMGPTLKALAATLEFHFNSCAGTQLFDYAYDEDTITISFGATGATCSGFNNVELLHRYLDKSQLDAYRELKSLIELQDSYRLQLTLVESDLDGRDLSLLRHVNERLPGGRGTLLPSIGKAEYYNVPIIESEIRSPAAWLRNRHPMVPATIGDTFSSIDQLCLQQSVGAILTHNEGDKDLQRFQNAPGHRVKIYKYQKFPILAMDFDENFRLSGTRLPNELEIEFRLDVHGKVRGDFRAKRKHRVPGLPKHHAYFVITSHPLSWLMGCAIDPNDKTDEHHWEAAPLHLKPHHNSFLLESQLDAMYALNTKDYSMWHAIALNQLHDAIPVVDALSGPDVEHEALQHAETWLRGCKSWNTEQLQVIEAMHTTKGHLLLCTGIAGSGKSTLQMAMAIFFAKIGGRALCTANSNGNVDHLTEPILEFGAEIQKMKLRVYRLNSTSRNVAIKDMSTEQILHIKDGHSNGNASNFLGFKFAVAAMKSKEVDGWAYSIEAAVLKEVEAGELEAAVSEEVEAGKLTRNHWTAFREYFEADKENKFNWGLGKGVKDYARSYEDCKAHLISLADILIATNGNARCKEIKRYWNGTKQADGYYKPGNFSGPIGVFMDEMAQEQEVNFWNTVTTPGLGRVPNIVVCFGDPRQLGPVNNCSLEPQFNPFAKRNDISLMSRLIREGWPYIELVEQFRMHPCLSQFPNQTFYENQLRDGAIVKRRLRKAKPGLEEVLATILRKSKPNDLFTDERLRLQYIELPHPVGEEIHTSDRGSLAFLNHIEIFFRKIFPELQEYFGASMEKDVMIICAYSNTIRYYDEKIHELQEMQQRSTTHYPRVLTMDAAQGQETTMAIVDGCFNHGDKMGFTADLARSNVALTRAKEVLWVMGASLKSLNWLNNQLPDSEQPPVVKLRKQLLERNQVSMFYPR